MSKPTDVNKSRLNTFNGNNYATQPNGLFLNSLSTSPSQYSAVNLSPDYGKMNQQTLNPSMMKNGNGINGIDMNHSSFFKPTDTQQNLLKSNGLLGFNNNNNCTGSNNSNNINNNKEQRGNSVYAPMPLPKNLIAKKNFNMQVSSLGKYVHKMIETVNKTINTYYSLF